MADKKTFYLDLLVGIAEGLEEPLDDIRSMPTAEIDRYGKQIVDALKKKGLYINTARNDPSGRW